MPTINLKICGVQITLTAYSSILTDLFIDYFRYYAPEASPANHSPRAGGIVVELKMLDELPPREQLIPPQAKLFSQTGVLGLWYEKIAGNGSSPRARFYFYMGVAAFMVNPESGRIFGYLTPQALEYPHILANTYTLFPLLLLLRSFGVYHLHAAAVVSPGGKLWLICGAQRAGKTTLTTALGLAGWLPISDDSLLIDFDGSAARIAALKKYFHLGNELLCGWEGLAKAARHHHYLDRTCIGGLEFFNTRKLADVRFEKVDAIVIPQITNRAQSRIEPIAGSEALLKLAEQSMFFQLWREHVERQWKALGALARQAQSYRLLAGRDLLDDPRRAAEILEERMNSN
jgi:hypothetical protein